MIEGTPRPAARSAWVVIETKPLAEEVAERSLRQSGYRVYLPRYRKVLRPHGRLRVTATSMRPLFPQILFAHDWRGWPRVPVLGTAGLMFQRPGRPATLGDVDMAIVMARELAGAFDEVPCAQGDGVVRTDIAAGDEVEASAFGTRIIGVLEDLTDDGKAIIAALMFGRTVRAEVAAEAVRRTG